MSFQVEDLDFDPEDAEECDNLDDFLLGTAEDMQAENLHWDLVSSFALFQATPAFWMSSSETAMCKAIPSFPA